VPLTRDGELKFVASSDLGGLGAKEGPPVSYDWTRPSVLPPLLPWLGVLLLLVLRPNRVASAWWIWLPLGCVFVVEAAMGVLLEFIPSEAIDLFRQVVHALAFGVVAIWLTAPYLASQFRFLAFLKMLLVQGGACLFVWLLQQNWSEFDDEQGAALISLGVLSLVVVGALCLAGFHCRQGFRPVRFMLSLGLWVLAGVALAVLPFALFAAVSQGAEVWLPFGISILVGAGVCFALLLPFLVLCLANHFYREGLRELLRMGVAAAPPFLVPGSAPAPAV
jgi:hypothetical protein